MPQLYLIRQIPSISFFKISLLLSLVFSKDLSKDFSLFQLHIEGDEEYPKAQHGGHQQWQSRRAPKEGEPREQRESHIYVIQLASAPRDPCSMTNLMTLNFVSIKKKIFSHKNIIEQ